MGNWRDFQKGPGAKRARVQVCHGVGLCEMRVYEGVLVGGGTRSRKRVLGPKPNHRAYLNILIHTHIQAYKTEENAAGGKKHGQHNKEEWRKSWK